MQRRRLRLTFVASGESAAAELLDEEAPEVCRMVWDLLPVEHSVIHGMYSGQEVFLLLDNPQPAPPENLTQLPLPGEILYFYDPGGNVTSARKPGGEICIVYGRGVTLRGPEGAPTYCSLFARIPGDWKYDWTAFAQACRRARWEGPQRLRIERAEP
ncbi:MAG: DUF3830 family protein [Candidatus Solibacter usitatus]|nr:DUF3830 family protein [Candidatus Solibacter usitatus]